MVTHSLTLLRRQPLTLFSGHTSLYLADDCTRSMAALHRLNLCSADKTQNLHKLKQMKLKLDSWAL